MSAEEKLEAQLDNAAEPDTSTTISLSDTPPKRKRGRPRKIIPAEELALQKKRKATEEAFTMVAPGTAWDALEHPENYLLPPKKQGYASQKADVIRSDAPREQIVVRVRAELKRAVQLLAVTQGLTLSDIIEELLVKYIQENRNSLKSKEEE